MSYQTTPSLLDLIDQPADLKKIPREDLPKLAMEIREEIIRVVSANGGHLASSLGAVELIMALHYVLETPQDKIIFDVGHQAYAHKLLTGRRHIFGTLRREGGLSGFPKREESPYDAFDTGHSSTSISAALGLACARDLNGQNHTVAAVVGDGALTGGMALEAMNHAGALRKKLLVILNDNEMSISPNVGGIAEYLSLLATRPGYVKFRKKIKLGLHQYLPSRGHSIVKGLRRIEEALKSMLTSPSAIFETLGFKYLGPFDGHDLNRLIDGLKGAQNLERPVLMHVVTTKGKGYLPAEEDPCGFHGLGGQCPAPPVSVKTPNAAEEVETPEEIPTGQASYSTLFGRFMIAQAEANPKVAAITAAMSEGTGLAEFFKKFPERSFDVGIAEQHAITLCAGLAQGGLRPVAAIYSSFLQRSFDQLFHDVALQNLPVVIAVDRAGLVGEDGPTHHGGLDLSFLRLLPNFTVMAPADPAGFEAMLDLSLRLPGPSAIRYPRGRAEEGLPTPPPLELGRGATLMEGHDLAILTLGPLVTQALMAAQKLKTQGISATVVDMRFIKPLDQDLVRTLAQRTGHLLTVEENSLAGGLFGAISEILAGQSVKIKGLGLTDQPVHQATQKAQRATLGLDAEGIFLAATALLKT